MYEALTFKHKSKVRAWGGVFQGKGTANRKLEDRADLVFQGMAVAGIEQGSERVVWDEVRAGASGQIL